MYPVFPKPVTMSLYVPQFYEHFHVYLNLRTTGFGFKMKICSRWVSVTVGFISRLFCTIKSALNSGRHFSGMTAARKTLDILNQYYIHGLKRLIFGLRYVQHEATLLQYCNKNMLLLITNGESHIA